MLLCAAVLCCAAVAGNYADYIAFRGEQRHAASSNGTDSSSIVAHQWYTDYAKMSYSALMFYGYVFVLGLVLFFVLRWFRWVGCRCGMGWKMEAAWRKCLVSSGGSCSVHL
jgi:hypothetical protein